METQTQSIKPSVVTISRLPGRIYTTICFDIHPSDGEWGSTSVTFKGEISAEDVITTLRQNGTLALMRRDELDEMISRLPAADKTAVLRDLVRAQILSYDKSPAVNTFTFKDAPTWLSKDERMGLVNAANMRRLMGYNSIRIIIGTEAVAMTVDSALEMLAAVEVYANECYLATAANLKAISEMGYDDLMKFDIKQGYPNIININHQ